MTAPHKWGFNTCFLSPIYGALFCSTGIYARVGGQFLGFDVWIGVELKTTHLQKLTSYIEPFAVMDHKTVAIREACWGGFDVVAVRLE